MLFLPQLGRMIHNFKNHLNDMPISPNDRNAMLVSIDLWTCPDEIVECLHTDEVRIHRVSRFLQFRTHGLDEE